MDSVNGPAQLLSAGNLESIAVLKVPKIYFSDSLPGKSTKMRGVCLKNLSDITYLPESVGGLQAPTN